MVEPIADFVLFSLLSTENKLRVFLARALLQEMPVFNELFEHIEERTYC